MKIHTVRKGDTVQKIAKQYNVHVTEIQRVNHQLKTNDQLSTGMKIRVPSSKVALPTRNVNRPKAQPTATDMMKTPVILEQAETQFSIQPILFPSKPESESPAYNPGANAEESPAREVSFQEDDSLTCEVTSHVPESPASKEVSTREMESSAYEVSSHVPESPTPKEVSLREIESSAYEVSSHVLESPASKEMSMHEIGSPASEVTSHALESPASEVTSHALESLASEVTSHVLESPAYEVSSHVLESPEYEVTSHVLESPASEEVSSLKMESPAYEVSAHVPESPSSKEVSLLETDSPEYEVKVHVAESPTIEGVSFQRENSSESRQMMAMFAQQEWEKKMEEEIDSVFVKRPPVGPRQISSSGRSETTPSNFHYAKQGTTHNEQNQLPFTTQPMMFPPYPMMNVPFPGGTMHSAPLPVPLSMPLPMPIPIPMPIAPIHLSMMPYPQMLVSPLQMNEPAYFDDGMMQANSYMYPEDFDHGYYDQYMMNMPHPGSSHMFHPRQTIEHMSRPEVWPSWGADDDESSSSR